MKRYIKTSLGMYWRALETLEHVFYVNYQEGDENACVKMYDKQNELVSDNYFAYGYMFEVLTEKTWTKISRNMKYNLKLYLEATKNLPTFA